MSPTDTAAEISGEPGRRGKRKGKLHISQELALTKINSEKQFYAPADSPPTTGSGFLQETGNTPDSSSFC